MNLAVSAASHVAGIAQAQTEQWNTTMGQCEGVENKHWAYAIFCPLCAAAQAKGEMDQTHPVFNFFCFTPIGGYSYVRQGYNIMGECGQDCINGGLCMPCGVRQMYTESQTRRQIAGRFGETSGNWNTQLGECNDCGEFFKAVFCPCIVSHEIHQMMQPKADNCFDYFCIIPMSMYGQVRVTYGIGSEWPHPVCEDLCVGLLLYPCALNRSLREAVFQKQNAAAATVANVAQAGMNKVNAMGQNAMGKLGQLGGKRGGGGGSAPPPGHMA